RGHRFHAPRELQAPSPRRYVEALREAHVVADWAERKKRIEDEVRRAAKEANGEPIPDDELLETVTGLVEEPYGVRGSFDQGFLELPQEVLVSEMRGHQKYFAVRDPGTMGILPAFVAVSNTKVRDPAVSRRGYERVLRARLSDGKFFFDEDRKTPLASRNERLARTVFVQGLGTQMERVARIGELVGIFSIGKAPTGPSDAFGLRRAAIGLLRIVLARKYRFDLRDALGEAQRILRSQVSAQPKAAKEDVADKVWAFVHDRL